MNDSFSAKRGMMSQLLAMLKKHAADEVDSGLRRPEGEGDMHGLQDEKVEVLPDHEMDKSTPEHEVDTKLIPEGKSTANMNMGGMAYSKGGVVEDVNAETYSREAAGKIPYEPQSGDGQPEKEGSAHEEATESQEERQAEGDTTPSMFEMFLRKKKK
jgi:hypothetical protein